MALYTATPEFLAALPAHHEKWLGYALRTKPYTKQEEAVMPDLVRNLYRAADLAPPSRICFADDPVSGSLVSGVTVACYEDPRLLKYAPRALELIAETTGASAESVNRLFENIRPAENAKPVESDAERVARWTKKSALEHLTKAMSWGWELCDLANEWIGWVEYVAAFQEIAKLDLPQYEKFNHCKALAVYGPRFLYSEFCAVSRLSQELKIDEQNRPHCATGPCRSYANGVKFYYWRGQRVEPAWIESPHTIDPSLALTHANSEMRRTLTEILGWDAILKSLEKGGRKAKVLDADKDPLIGTLFELDLGDDRGRPARFLRVRCGTGRTFVQRVDPSVKTALEGQAFFRSKQLGAFTPPAFRT